MTTALTGQGSRDIGGFVPTSNPEPEGDGVIADTIEFTETGTESTAGGATITYNYDSLDNTRSDSGFEEVTDTGAEMTAEVPEADARA